MLPTSLTLTDNDLPQQVLDEIVEAINDHLAEKYGYCNTGFGYEIKIDLDDITWDTED